MAKTTGVIAVFGDENQLLTAAETARQKFNFKKYDAFTPYPVHGLDDAMGIKRSYIPWVTFIAGTTGALSALAFEIWTSAIDWPVNIGGKPFISLPAFIPIVFELTVLFGGLSTLAALLYAAGLPNTKSRILHPSITNDKFVLYVPAYEEGFNESAIIQFFKGLNPEEVSVVAE